MSDRHLTTTEGKRLHRDWRRRTELPLGLLLDSVQTPFNVGAIFRTAAAFRVTHVWLAGASATPDHDKTRKTSLGTERLVPWSVVASVVEGAAAARAVGMAVVGIELTSGAEPLPSSPLTGACLVLGHESHGLSSAALSSCDRVAYVPTPGKVGSLNVATAAAIAIYEARRQEWTSEAEGVDLDAEAAGGAAGGGEGVG